LVFETKLAVYLENQKKKIVMMSKKRELAEVRKKVKEHQKEFHKSKEVITFVCSGNLWYFCPVAYLIADL